MADLKSTQKILRAGQYTVENSQYIVHAPKVFKKTKEQEIDESTQRIDELRDEIRTLEQELNVSLEKSETEAVDIIEKAEVEAERLIKQAEKSAFDRVQSSLDEKEQVLTEQDEESQTIVNTAQNEALQKVQEAEEQTNKIIEDAKAQGFEQGKKEGFQESKKEVAHMVERLHSVIKASMDERERIFVHSERQIINLVMTMVEKVVKRLTQEEQNVVIYNVKEALSLIRGAMKVFIHVHPDDYDITLEHKQELIDMIESNPQVKFLENPSVERGGAYIETDLGEIDATIATQLNDIQEQIKFYMPVKVSSNIKRPLSPRAQKAQEEAKDLPPASEQSVSGGESKVVGNPYWDNTQDVMIPTPQQAEERAPSPVKTNPDSTIDITPEEIDNSLEQSMLISDDHERDMVDDGPFTEAVEVEPVVVEQAPVAEEDEVPLEDVVDLDSIAAMADNDSLQDQ